MISLTYGDKLRFNCSFQHRGAAYTGAKLRAAIGNKGIVGFDEILSSGDIPVSGIIYDATWYTYTKALDVLITTTIAGGSYEGMVKLMGIPGGDLYWYGPLDDIVIMGMAEFENLTVTYLKV